MKKKLLFTLGCSFTEGDGAYPNEPFFEPEGIPIDGSRRMEIHGSDLQNWYRNTYTSSFHHNGWPAQLVRKLGYDKLINIGKCASSTSYQLKLLTDKYWDFPWDEYETLMIIYLTDSIRYSFYSGGVPQTFMCGDPERMCTLSGAYGRIIQDQDLDPLFEQIHHVKCLEGFCKQRGIELKVMNYWLREDKQMKEIYKTDVYMDPKPFDALPFDHANGEHTKWDTRYHSPICFHPNREGYRLMTENVFNKIEELHPHLIRNEKDFNSSPEIIWDGSNHMGFPNVPENREELIDGRIEFDHEGLKESEYEYFAKHGKLPWQ
jgi:hypothetical protein